MKAFSRISLLLITIVLFSVNVVLAQRVIKGTVYMDGEPAAGVTVEAHRGSTAFTGFDGKYEVDADEKSKWIRFTAADGTSEKLDLDENSGDNIEFPLTGALPGEDDGEVEVIMKTHDELVAEQNKDYAQLYTLYTQDMENEKFEDAYKNLKKVIKKYPASSSNHYIRGEKILKTLIESADTDEEKDKLLDELLNMFDKRIEYFGEEADIVAKKADVLLKYKLSNRINQLDDQSQINAIKKAYDWINSSVSELGNYSKVPTVILYMNTTTMLYSLDELPKETVVKNYDTSSKILNNIVERLSKVVNEKTVSGEDLQDSTETLNNAKDIAIPWIEEKFSESGAADCEALISIYTPQYEQNIDDAEFIKTIIAKLRRSNCDDNVLVEKATVRLYELDPSAEAAFNMAHSYLIKNEIENAKKYYELAIEQETDNKLLASYYYEFATVIYSKDQNYQLARDYAKKAISLDPSLCKANVLIGDIYVAASREFSDDNFVRSAVFWLAVDYYSKAKSNPECSSDATTKIADYSKHFPSKEDGFMDGIQDGDSYKLEGWINETTKAKF